MIKSKKLLIRCVLCAVLVFVLCVTVCLIRRDRPRSLMRKNCRKETEIVQKFPRERQCSRG